MVFELGKRFWPCGGSGGSAVGSGGGMRRKRKEKSTGNCEIESRL